VVGVILMLLQIWMQILVGQVLIVIGVTLVTILTIVAVAGVTGVVMILADMNNGLL
jgi:hypothetical protein